MTRVLTMQSRCRFGIASDDITPPVGIYHRMWGAATHDRSEGVHRPLAATAMYFGPIDRDTDPTSYQILVAIDHCLLGVDEVDMILDRAAVHADVRRDSITVTFSHTHAAGLLNLDRQDLPGGDLIPTYLEHLANTIARLVATAVATACEADIVYGTGRCHLAAHRDFFDVQNNEYVCGFNPDGPSDDTMTIARVTDKNSNALAAIVNYACHPTTLAWDNRLISPDYPGAMRETIQGVIGAPCVFLQGASGELGPMEGFVGDTNVADRHGRQLAFAALSVWESLPPANTSFEYAGKVVSGAAIGTWQREAVDKTRRAQLVIWGCDRSGVELDYRDDLWRHAEVEADYLELVAQEQTAREAGDIDEATRFRALAERQRRSLGRLKGMPSGDAFPLNTVVWRMGDAIWIAVQGEPYSLLQRRIRENFPLTPIVVATIANGWGPSYLPPRETYGTGIYQESIAWLAPGSLETLIDALSARIAGLLSAEF